MVLVCCAGQIHLNFNIGGEGGVAPEKFGHGAAERGTARTARLSVDGTSDGGD